MFPGPVGIPDPELVREPGPMKPGWGKPPGGGVELPWVGGKEANEEEGLIVAVFVPKGELFPLKKPGA